MLPGMARYPPALQKGCGDAFALDPVDQHVSAP